jgi:hypothetical protein
MVIAPARTGRDRSKRTAVIRTAHANRGIRSRSIPNTRRLPTVLMKFTAPKIDLTPAKCSEKIAKSTDEPAWAIFPERGGYTVHPVPAPLSTSDLVRSITKAGIKNQNLILFIRGNAMSAAPSIRGTSQFPNPPIKIGITMKKIMIKA